MSFGQRNNQSRPQGKEDAFNKVKFSSVKLGETKQGSPTVGIYLGKDKNGVNHMERLHALLGELLSAGEEGCKLSCIVIRGEKYDSGYAYVNPKEERKQEQGGSNGGYRKQNNGFKDKSQARSFFQSKRINDGEAQGEGN